MAKPFLKWAGGKSALVPRIARAVPSDVRTYYEPFLGGAAVFFALQARGIVTEARLSDLNDDLIEAYETVRTRTDQLIDSLRELENRYLGAEDRSVVYYAVRNEPPPTDDIGRVARLIFLNKTGYNGLYRVNREGKFNVPHGRYEQPRICDERVLRQAAFALAGVDLEACDFGSACESAAEGDFVYFDPPYQPVSDTALFTSYTDRGFSWKEQVRLCECAVELRNRGVRLLISNSAHPDLRALYEAQGFEIQTVQVGRAINSLGTGRGPVSELLISDRPVPASQRQLELAL